MGAISVDSRGYAAEQRGSSAKAVGRGLILLAALAAVLLGIYWLASAPPGSERAGPAATAAAPAQPAPVPARTDGTPAAAEPLLNAPAATCVDGRPASPEIPADACL